MKTIVTAIVLLAGIAPALAGHHNNELQIPGGSSLGSNGIAAPPGYAFGGGGARYSGGGGGYSASACATSRGYCATNVSIGAKCGCTDRAGKVYPGTGQ
jgi:hypothetical protein